MDHFLTWGAIILSGSSIVAVIRFWMAMGAAANKADMAADTATLLAAKLELHVLAVADFKVSVAQTYATSRALEATEASLVRGMEKAMEGVYSRLDNITSRLDSLIQKD